MGAQIVIDVNGDGTISGAVSGSLISADDPFLVMKRMLANVECPVIFDIGAHHGQLTLLFRKIFPNALIAAFEPCPYAFAELEKNIVDDKRIKAFNFGFANQCGNLTFHRNQSGLTNSLLASDEQAGKTWRPGLLDTVQVGSGEFWTLSSFFEEFHYDHGDIDILKMDVQGAEHLVLEGLDDPSRVKIIYSEVIMQPTYKGQLRFDQMLKAFYDKGFDLYNIYNMSFTSDGWLRQVDVIFTRKEVDNAGTNID